MDGLRSLDFAMLEQRFWSKVDLQGPLASPYLGPCWSWTASISYDGYGHYSQAGRIWYAHRWAWTMMRGEIPVGLGLDHLCRQKHCVNPAHLEPVTQRENVLRGNGLAAQCARRTHCPRGHPYDEINTYYRPNGGRFCRTCKRAGNRAYKARKKRSAEADLS